MSLNVPLLKEMSADGPLSSEQVRFLRDVQGFIEYAIRNGLSLEVIYGMFRHDFGGMLEGDGRQAGFLPRIEGFARELKRIAEDPEAQRAIRQAEAEFGGPADEGLPNP